MFCALATALVLSLIPARCAAASGSALRILSPQPEEVLCGPDVVVHFELSGVTVQPGGCNLHFILDDQPFEVQFDATHPHVFRDVRPGTHTVRAFACNSMHEAYPGIYDIVTFSVGYPSDENRPAPGLPLLTYNLPQGEYLGIDGADVTLNFLVDGAQTCARGYNVQYFVDGKRQLANGCMTQHLTGMGPGFHRIRLELLDYRGNRVEGPFNAAERVILLSPAKTLPRLRAGQKPPKQPTLPSVPGAMTMGRPWQSMESESAPPAKQSRAASPGRDTVTVEEEIDTNGDSAEEKPAFSVREPTRIIRRDPPVNPAEELVGPRPEMAPDTEPQSGRTGGDES